MNDLSTDLDSGKLLDEVVAQSGLEDFGDESFRQPFTLLAEDLDKCARLSVAGRIGARMRLVSHLQTRLNVEAYYTRYPEIEDEPVDVAAVIVGLPRTGTTMLHRVLSSDTQFLVPRFFESRFPTPPLDWDFSGEDPRIAWIQAEIDATLAASPELAAVHPFQATGAEEELMMLEHSFFSTVPEAYYRVPNYGRWLEANDNAPGYRYLVRLLKLLQWQKRRRGEAARKWLLKTPHHLHHMDLLLDTFPGAQVIQTHRDPLQTIPSIVSFHRYLCGMGSDDVDLPELAVLWRDKFAAGMRKTLAARDARPERFIDVDFRDTVGNPDAVIGAIYEAIDLPLTSAARAAMDQWRAENPRDARPPHEYSLAEFGFTEDALAACFSEYRQRYIVAGA